MIPPSTSHDDSPRSLDIAARQQQKFRGPAGDFQVSGLHGILVFWGGSQVNGEQNHVPER